DLAGDLKAGAREGTFQRSRIRIALLVLQGALCVVLLVGAGLFVRSLQHVRVVPLGYDVDPVLLVDLNMRGVQLDSAHGVALRRDLLETAQAIPEVMHASRQLTVPFWSTSTMELHVAGIDSVHRLGEFALNAVTPEYFATLGTRILRGRGIAIQDAKNAPRAIVVSDAMAKTLWPGRDPIGQCVKVGADTLPCSYVVGVAENIKYQHLGDDPGLFYYVSEAQWHPEQRGLFIRTRGQASPVAAHPGAGRPRRARGTAARFGETGRQRRLDARGRRHRDRRRNRARGGQLAGPPPVPGIPARSPRLRVRHRRATRCHRGGKLHP